MQCLTDNIIYSPKIFVLDNRMSNGQLVQNALDGVNTGQVPVWLMRQAGRYLPEYRALRSQTPNFMEFCRNASLCCEATLQPINRFGFDAAIIFSDILVIPDALGQEVTFESGVGPRLNALKPENCLNVISERVNLTKLNGTFEALALVRSKLPNEVSLIGFCGAPWTVASYMIAGRGTPDQGPARLFAYRYPDIFRELIERLIEASVIYLDQQVKAGADILQIFDSWAGVLPGQEFISWCERPVLEIVERVKSLHPDVKIIVFSRGSGIRLNRFTDTKSIDCIGIDTSTDLNWISANIPGNLCVQGNLDPLALLAGGPRLIDSINHILASLQDRAFIFNLGHGILPETPIEHVETMVTHIRSWSRT